MELNQVEATNQAKMKWKTQTAEAKNLKSLDFCFIYFFYSKLLHRKNIGYFKLCKVMLEKKHKIIYNIKSENKNR